MSVLVMYIIESFINTLGLYLSTDAGMPLAASGAYNSLVFAMSMVGKVLSGVGSDTAYSGAVALASCGLMLLGTCCVLRVRFGGPHLVDVEPTTSHAQLVVFAMVYGLGYGTSFSIIQVKAAQLYGSKEGYVQLQSFLTAFQFGGGFVGTLATGMLRDATGSYRASFLVYPWLALATCAHCVCVVRRSRRRGG